MTKNFINGTSKILMVDDLPKNLQVLGNILRDNKFDIEFATSGKAALKWLEQKEFDLVLLDVMMPEMDGYTVCEIIRENKKWENLPIIFLTAKNDTDSVVRGFEIGGQDYIGKPFNAKELISRVNTQIALKKSREKLAGINSWLEIEVKKRTKELLFANQRLLDLDKSKAQFLNIISHEIRTPLNGIKGGITLIKEFETNSEVLSFIEILDESTERLENFAFKALDISHLNSKGKKALELFPMNLISLLEDVISDYQFNDKNIIIVNDLVGKEFIVEADKCFLTKALSELISNSINFSDMGSRIIISVIKTETELELVIQDEGDGFPSDFDFEKIQPFENVNHVDNNPGLGLYLATRVFRVHGGDISVGNNSDKGAFVKIKLPVFDL